jgi:hypothetical protein
MPAEGRRHGPRSTTNRIRANERAQRCRSPTEIPDYCAAQERGPLDQGYQGEASVRHGKQISPADAFPHSKDWNLIYWNIPDEGLAVSLQLPTGPVDMTVFAISDGLPPLPGNVPLQPRPDDLIPSPSFCFDHETFIQKSFLSDQRSDVCGHSKSINSTTKRR